MSVQTEHAHSLPFPFSLGGSLPKHITPSSPHHFFFTDFDLILKDFPCCTSSFMSVSLHFLLSSPTLFCILAPRQDCIFSLLSPRWTFSPFLPLVFLSLCPLPPPGSVVVRVSDFSLVWLQAVPAAALIDIIPHFLTAFSFFSAFSILLLTSPFTVCHSVEVKCMYHTQ